MVNTSSRGRDWLERMNFVSSFSRKIYLSYRHLLCNVSMTKKWVEMLFYRVILRNWSLKFKLGIEGFNLDLDSYLSVLISSRILSINEDLFGRCNIAYVLNLGKLLHNCLLQFNTKSNTRRGFRIRVHRGWINISDGQIRQFHDWIVQLW